MNNLFFDITFYLPEDFKKMLIKNTVENIGTENYASKTHIATILTIGL
jgi:hypothetical protein